MKTASIEEYHEKLTRGLETMKIELTLETLEEIALCIVHNQLNEDEACNYIRNVAFECHEKSIKQACETAKSMRTNHCT